MIPEEHVIALSQNENSLLVSKLKYLYSYLFKKWWLFLCVGLIAGLCGFFYAALQKPVYKSRLTFALDEGGSGGAIGGFASLASQFGLNVGGGKDVFAGENIIEILKSRRMLERVLLSADSFENKSFTLIEYYLNISGKRTLKNKLATIHFPLGQPRSAFTYVQDSVLKNVYKELVSQFVQANKPDRKLNIFEVNVTSRSEKFSKIFTERLVNETNQFYVEIRTKKAKGTLDALESRVAAMKGNLTSSIRGRAAVQDENVNTAFAAGQVPVIQQQTNIQAYSGAYSEMFKNLEIARFQYLNDIPLLQIIDAADYPMEKIKMGKLLTSFLFAFFFELLLFIFVWFRWENIKNVD